MRTITVNGRHFFFESRTTDDFIKNCNGQNGYPNGSQQNNHSINNRTVKCDEYITEQTLQQEFRENEDEETHQNDLRYREDEGDFEEQISDKSKSNLRGSDAKPQPTGKDACIFVLFSN